MFSTTDQLFLIIAFQSKDLYSVCACMGWT